MLRLFTTWILTTLVLSAFPQITNGSFESNGTPSLDSWSFVCGKDSFPDAAPGGGNWCLQLEAGNSQGCFPGYAWQAIPQIDSGEVWQLTGWAKIDSNFAPFRTIGVHFAIKDSSGGFFPFIFLKDDTTSAIIWDSLTVVDTFHLNKEDTVFALLDAGMTGGPVFGQAYFDRITLKEVFPDTMTNGIASVDNFRVSVYPNPFNQRVNIAFSLTEPGHVNVKIFNALGQVVYHENRWRNTGKYLITKALKGVSALYICTIQTNSGGTTVKLVQTGNDTF